METKTVSFWMNWVPGGTRAAGLARRSILSVEAGPPNSVRHRLALLLSELVTNAIQHGGAGEHETIQVRIASSYEKVRVEVFDPGPERPPARATGSSRRAATACSWWTAWPADGAARRSPPAAASPGSSSQLDPIDHI